MTKRNAVALYITGLLVLLLAGWILIMWTATNPEKTLSGGAGNSLLRLYTGRCERSGGEQYFSDAGMYRCGWEPTTDAKRVCTASFQCEAGCYCDSDVMMAECFQCAPYRRGAGGTVIEEYPYNR